MAIDMLDMIVNAAKLAHKWHRGQFRKYTKRPYVEHPGRVASRVLIHSAGTADMVAAAWLHDVLEDTKCPASTIARECGLGVLELVEGLTNPSKGMVANRETRKKVDREHLAKQGVAVQIIKLADRLDNLLDMEGSEDDFKTTYAQESRLLVTAIGGADSDLRGEILSQCMRLESQVLHGREQNGQVA